MEKLNSVALYFRSRKIIQFKQSKTECFSTLNKLPFSVLDVHQTGPKVSDRQDEIFLARCLHTTEQHIYNAFFFSSTPLEGC